MRNDRRIRGCASFLLALWLTALIPRATADVIRAVGPGVGIQLPSPDENPCPGSDLFMNHDGSSENGYGWSHGGVVPPDYGAFAEGYAGIGAVCGAQLLLTTLPGYYMGQSLDILVYDSDGANPANVLGVTTGILIDPPAVWPNVSAHDIDVIDVILEGDYFIAYWPNWPGGELGWFCGADLNGPGGVPRTKIAPGIGYPTGWSDVSIVWGPTQALGVGAYFDAEGPPPNPTIGTSWGRVKGLYR